MNRGPITICNRRAHRQRDRTVFHQSACPRSASGFTQVRLGCYEIQMEAVLGGCEGSPFRFERDKRMQGIQQLSASESLTL